MLGPLDLAGALPLSFFFVDSCRVDVGAAWVDEGPAVVLTGAMEVRSKCPVDVNRTGVGGMDAPRLELEVREGSLRISLG